MPPHFHQYALVLIIAASELEKHGIETTPTLVALRKGDPTMLGSTQHCSKWIPHYVCLFTSHDGVEILDFKRRVFGRTNLLGSVIQGAEDVRPQTQPDGDQYCTYLVNIGTFYPTGKQYILNPTAMMFSEEGDRWMYLQFLTKRNYEELCGDSWDLVKALTKPPTPVQQNINYPRPSAAYTMPNTLDRDCLSVVFDFLERPTIEQAIDGQIARTVAAGLRQNVQFFMEDEDQSYTHG